MGKYTALLLYNTPMTNDLKTINTNEETEYKWWLLEKIRNSRKKALTRIVAASSLLWSPNVATVAWGTWLALFSTMLTSCSDEPDNPLPEKDTTRPRIEIKRPEVDISWWKKISINWNRLYIWDLLTAERSDNVTTNCKVELFFNNDPITSWTTINKEWLLTIIVTDDAGNSETSSIKLSFKEQLVSWLENINNLSMKVNEEIDLLKWVQISDNLIATVTIEADWKKIEVTDPHHYVPEFPWTCIIYVDIKDINWNPIDSFTSNILNIAPLEYHEPTFNTVDIHENYPRYFNLTNSALKETIRPQIILSILTCNLDNPPKMSIILMWETWDSEYVNETVLWPSTPTAHGTGCSWRMRLICPDYNKTHIVWCNTSSRSDVKTEYVDKCPEDELFVISASWALWWTTNQENIKNSEFVKSLKEMLKTGRVIVVTGSWNADSNIREVYNEDIPNWTFYNITSTNSINDDWTPCYNKFTVIWEIPWIENYFSSSRDSGASQSLRPVWFGLEKWNIVMPSSPVATIQWRQDLSTTQSSFPTAITSSMIYNTISTIMAYWNNINDMESATKTMVTKYYNKEKIKDKKNGNIVESWDYKYYIDATKIIEDVVLHLPELNNIQFSSEEPIQLPNYKRQCYIGKWFMFEYNWNLYECNEGNASLLKQASVQWKITKRIFNPRLFKQYGWWSSVYYKTFILDINWRIIPDTEYECNNTISNTIYNYNLTPETWFKYNYTIPNSWNNYYITKDFSWYNYNHHQVNKSSN